MGIENYNASEIDEELLSKIDNKYDSLLIFKLDGEIVHMRLIRNNFSWRLIYFEDFGLVDEIVIPPFKCIDAIRLEKHNDLKEILNDI